MHLSDEFINCNKYVYVLQIYVLQRGLHLCPTDLVDRRPLNLHVAVDWRYLSSPSSMHAARPAWGAQCIASDQG
jgi:hypothetical protein